ncbi:E3 ubiquitin-protein ligase RNF213, partial [Tinamus guttatus]
EEVCEATKKNINQSKGPGVARKETASAVASSPKDTKKQNNQKPVDKMEQRDDVTVYFHAILSKDFKLKPDVHKVFVRAGGISGYEDWKENICEMTCTK